MTAFLGMPTAPRGTGHLRGAEPFPVAARRALADSQLRRNLAQATGTIRAKRAAVVAELPDWEELREAGRAIKAATLAGSGLLPGAAGEEDHRPRRNGALGGRRHRRQPDRD